MITWRRAADAGASDATTWAVGSTGSLISSSCGMASGLTVSKRASIDYIVRRHSFDTCVKEGSRLTPATIYKLTRMKLLNILESNLPPVFLTVSATVSHLGRSRLSRLSSCFAHGKVDGEPTEYTNEHQNEHARLHRLDRKAVGKSSRTCERQSAASQDHLGSNVTHRMGR